YCLASPAQSQSTVNGSSINACDQSPQADNTTTLTLDCGSKVQTGQLAIADVLTYNGAGPTITPPQGWTLIRDDSSDSTRQSLYWHVIDASEPGYETWTFSEPVNAQGVLLLLDDVAGSADPIDASSGNPGHSGTLTADSLQTSSAGDLVLAFYATDFEGVGPGHDKPNNMSTVLDEEGSPLEYWILATSQTDSGDLAEATCTTPQLFNWVAAQVAFKTASQTASR
ncbi:MAG TPA: hypothetical protein VMB26_04640, partial [Candidatus Binataceae bacterium]|nr:hypothetical protein [Candidatus Binataceae bacterium]